MQAIIPVHPELDLLGAQSEAGPVIWTGNLAGLFVLEMLSASPSARKLSNGEMGLTDPALVAYKVLEARMTIAEEWAASIPKSVPPALQELLQQDLERQFSADGNE